MSYEQIYEIGVVRLKKGEERILLEIKLAKLTEELREDLCATNDPEEIRQLLITVLQEQEIEASDTASPKHVLIVSDNPSFFEDCLKGQVASVKTVSTTADFFIALTNAQKDNAADKNALVDIILFDIIFEKKDRGGLILLNRWRNIDANTPAILLTREQSRPRAEDLHDPLFTELQISVQLEDDLPQLITELCH